MTRNGKIARLPRELREQLNRRLENGETGVRLVEWLNTLPEVWQVLRAEFEGRPLNEQNLSDWKAGGYQDWLAKREILHYSRNLAADADEVAAATAGRMSDHLATLVAARYAAALAGWDGQPSPDFDRKLRALRGLSQAVAELRRGDLANARLKFDQERLEHTMEKTADEIVELFEHWLEAAPVRDWICQHWPNPEERKRQLRELYGLPTKNPDETATLDATRNTQHAGPSPEKPDETATDPPKPGPADPNQVESSQIKPVSSLPPDKPVETAADSTEPDPKDSNQESELRLVRRLVPPKLPSEGGSFSEGGTPNLSDPNQADSS